MNWTLEVVVVPVSDVDRAKAFYADRLGFRVEKVPGDPTHTRIEELDDALRRDELERMAGGAEFLASMRKT